jgi:hypothetical protein
VPLTVKQEAFVKEYLTDLNGTKAAVRAGYSPRTATKIALQLLDKTGVSQAIEEAMAERAKRLEITQDLVLAGLYAEANRVGPGASHAARVQAVGDFVGRGIWRFEQVGQFVDLTYDWEVRVEKPLLRRFSFALKPLFAANHSRDSARTHDDPSTAGC